MGQAKLRAIRKRAAQAQAKIEASRPGKLVCNGCNADVTKINPVSTRGLRGLDSLWVGHRDCGQRPCRKLANRMLQPMPFSQRSVKTQN